MKPSQNCDQWRSNTYTYITNIIYPECYKYDDFFHISWSKHENVDTGNS